MPSSGQDDENSWPSGADLLVGETDPNKMNI